MNIATVMRKVKAYFHVALQPKQIWHTILKILCFFLKQHNFKPYCYIALLVQKLSLCSPLCAAPVDLLDPSHLQILHSVVQLVKVGCNTPPPTNTSNNKCNNKPCECCQKWWQATIKFKSQITGRKYHIKSCNTSYMTKKSLRSCSVQYARENRNSLYVRMNEHHPDVTKRNQKTSKLSRPECPSGSWTSKHYQKWGAGGLLYETCRLERLDFLRHVGWKAVCCRFSWTW